MPLINCKLHLEWNWTKNFVMFDIAGNTEFKITNAKLYVPIVILSTKHNVKLTKQSNKDLKDLFIRISRRLKWNQEI